MASRAYHMFPHLTTALVGRATFQPDLARAHLTYEYTFLEVFTVLAVYCMARLLAGSRAAGYVAAMLMFLGAVPNSPLSPENARSFMYFCVWPQSSSMVEPVLMTSPQQFSANLVTYGILLAVAVASSRIARGLPAGRIMLAAFALVGIMLRFRVQTFLPLMPGMLLLSAYYYRRTLLWTYPVAAGLAAAVALLLFLEMRLPIYQPNTSSLSIGNNKIGFTLSFLSSWPGATSALELLESIWPRDSRAFQWIWQITCLTLFALLNIVGLPLLIAATAFLLDRKSWLAFGGFKALVVWLVMASIAGACCISATYDSWSVGGQMLLHTNWYLYPLLGPGLCVLIRKVPGRIMPRRSVLYALGALATTVVFVWQIERPPSLFELQHRKANILLDVHDVEVLRHIRTNLPEDSVILSNRFFCPNTAFFSGMGGRRAYLEYFPSIERFLDQGADTEESRLERISSIWSVETEAGFCDLMPHVVTHVIEFRKQPLKVKSPRCMKVVWTSADGDVRIWEVVH
jgi:hypothetical protein